MILIFIGFIIIPLVMFVGGYMMKQHPPKNRNGFYGYRTAKSMKSADTWKFAHEYCGRIWLKVGIPMLVVSFLLFLIAIMCPDDVLGKILVLTEIIQTVILLASIMPVEKALGKLFDQQGNPVGDLSNESK